MFFSHMKTNIGKTDYKDYPLGEGTIILQEITQFNLETNWITKFKTIISPKKV